MLSISSPPQCINDCPDAANVIFEPLYESVLTQLSDACIKQAENVFTKNIYFLILGNVLVIGAGMYRSCCILHPIYFS